MKKKILSLLCAALLLVTLLVSCGGSAKTEAMDAIAPSAPSYTAGGSISNSKAEISYDSVMDMEYPKLESGMGSSATVPAEATPQKLIYTATLEMQTTEFDASMQALAELVSRMGGYFSTNNVRNYSSGYRTADFVVRIPADRYEEFLAQAGDLCHVLRRYSSADDISEQYYDMEGRLKTQETKLTRLQELLKQAKNMEDIITIESAISQTEEQIEYLSGTLRRYDALVDYSTVNITLSEVYRLANTEEPVKGFGSRFVTALKSGWENFVDDTEDFLIDLAYSWMWVIVWVVVIVLAVRAIRRRKANGCKIFRRKKMEEAESNDQ